MQKLYARRAFHPSKLNEYAFDTQASLKMYTSYAQSIHKIEKFILLSLFKKFSIRIGFLVIFQLLYS